MIIAKQLVKNFKSGNIETNVLKGIDVEIKNGEFVAIIGRSGAGKSTLLYQLSLLDRPTSGAIQVDGKDVLALSSDQRVNFRLHNLGYVFQDYALMPELSAWENVALLLLMQGKTKPDAKELSVAALEKVGLGERVNNLPSQLSGGEQQRVSIARAIAHSPKIIFADEPTANLDLETSDKVLQIFLQLNKQGQTIVMVTHEEEYAAAASRIIKLADGKII
jgi:putative ABC transport system ATP-binding protein